MRREGESNERKKKNGEVQREREKKKMKELIGVKREKRGS